jgi:Domain of unknown function (DUF6398)
MIGLDELKIPKGLRPVADDIVVITDRVCSAILDEEYADLARRAVAKLARKRPSPLPGGRRATWAAGVLYALGQVPAAPGQGNHSPRHGCSLASHADRGVRLSWPGCAGPGVQRGALFAIWACQCRAWLLRSDAWRP